MHQSQTNVVSRGETPKAILSPALFVLSLVLFLAAPVRAAATLDTTFGSGGKVTTSWGAAGGEVRAILLQPDGKLVAVGFTGAPFDFVLARYLANGTLDASFGSGGKVTTDINGSANRAYGAVLQPDGKIVVVGDGSGGLAVARYNSNGTLDDTFGTGGIVLAPVGGVGYAVALQPDGKIVVTGQTPESPFSDVVVIRYASNGSLDTSLNGGGVVITTFQGADLSRDGASAITVQADGKIVVVGWWMGGKVGGGTGVLRYHSNGTLDATFGSSGKKTFQYGTGFYAPKKIALQEDSKFAFSDGLKLPLSLTNSSGLNFAFESPTLDASSLLRKPNGQFVVAGTANRFQAPTEDFGVAFYSVRGRLLNRTVTDFFAGTDEAFDSVLQPDGKLVVAGVATTGVGERQFALVRYNALNLPQVGDFDADGRTDLAVWRASNGSWHILNSGNGSFSGYFFGISTDLIVPSDYDGDSRTDIAVFRDGVWHILGSTVGYRAFYFGQQGDTPVPADYDGDGKTDVAVFRQGIWHILRSSDNAYQALYWGLSTDLPFPGDYDRDGKADVAIYRASQGAWHVLRSSTNTPFPYQFGTATDKPVPADYDGDGATDVAVYRPSDGTWHILQSSNGFRAQQFGISTDTPIPGDYDGDGQTDVAIFRQGSWQMLQSRDGLSYALWGLGSDVPIPARP